MSKSRFTKSRSDALVRACAFLLALGMFALWSTRVASADSQAAYSIRRSSDVRAMNAITSTLFLPLAGKEIAPVGCYVPGQVYGTVAIIPPPTDRPAEAHADLNLALRGYVTTTATLGLVDLGGGSDPNAPQLYNLFQDTRTPTFTVAYRVYDWNWTCNCRGAPLTDWNVTLAGMATLPNEIIRVPGSGYDIGRMPGGYEVMVLYAASNRVTLKYTREDNVVSGYTVHIENICVEPTLLYLYNAMNAAGRAQLPALNAGQAIGRAMNNQIAVAIRDTGQFMDPRSRKDWWIGR
ncbi:MAG: hypothetical protein HY868_24935 [Chloroflexi bacterium]|nr:hypothetical protein [Chloroflexota bacterium]